MTANEETIQSNLVVIHEPIWKDNSVGVAERKIVGGGFFLRIDYKAKDGSILFPGTYWIATPKAMEYPRQMVRTRSGFALALRVIPISVFETVTVLD